MCIPMYSVKSQPFPLLPHHAIYVMTLILLLHIIDDLTEYAV